MVFFCIARQVWIYVEGWKDSRWRKRRAQKTSSDDGDARGKKEVDQSNRVGKGYEKRWSRKERVVGKRRGRRARIVVRGRYTLVLR